MTVLCQNPARCVARSRILHNMHVARRRSRRFVDARQEAGRICEHTVWFWMMLMLPFSEAQVS
jgi:hypothetical protein